MKLIIRPFQPGCEGVTMPKYQQRKTTPERHCSLQPKKMFQRELKVKT
jgi:hypothetical protein